MAQLVVFAYHAQRPKFSSPAPHTKVGVVVYVCDPNTEKMEAGGLLAFKVMLSYIVRFKGVRSKGEK